MNNIFTKFSELKDSLGFFKMSGLSSEKKASPESPESVNSSNDSSKDSSNNQTNEENKNKKSVKEFFISVVKNIVYVLLWWVIGANFIYFMYSDLNVCFPTDKSKAPYVPYSPYPAYSMFGLFNDPKLKGVTSKWDYYLDKFENILNENDKKRDLKNNSKLNENSSELKHQIKYDTTKYSCSEHETMVKEMFNSKKFKRFLGFNKESFPYTWNNKPSQTWANEPSVLEFFGRSAQFSYISFRNLIKETMKSFSELGNSIEFGESLIFIIGFPLLYLIFLFQLPLMVGFITTLYGEITEGGMLLSILGFFVFSVTLLYPMIIGIVQSFQLLLKFTIIPSIVNSQVIWKIMKCKMPLMFLIFSCLTIFSAFTHLEELYSIIISIILLLISYTILYKLKKNLFREISESE